MIPSKHGTGDPERAGLTDGRIRGAHSFFLLLLLMGACGGSSLETSPREEAGFVPLFDGESFTGWEGDLEWFRIEDGSIVAGSLERPVPHNVFLATTEEFSDFELRLEVRLAGDPEQANAGIQIRSRRMPDHHEMIGYQADMGQHYWGCLYDESRRNRILAEPDREKLAAVLRRDGWNEYVIRCEGPRIQLWINGYQTVDYLEQEQGIARKGLIGLQIHGGPPAEASYRNIRIEKLPPIAFRRHEINPDSAFEAAAFADLNGDSQLDIISGGFWYEGPGWEKRFLREVPEQDEYYFDFANLPYDVDGDGRIDILTVAWHNEAVSWVRNGSDGTFTLEQIDQPGNMETALLVDINGDGLVDLLPAVVNAPTWYEASLEGSRTRFQPHPLPPEMQGHGLGAGDIDGDGRVDLVAPGGWLQNSPGGEWKWHGGFDLGSASVPILVHDVDGDGDADLIWGMGHDYGLYWLEQSRGDEGERNWVKHPVDESWSQAHFLALADIDGDGREDLVTGKRYRAHNGRDPGSDDPQAVYWYTYDSGWRRHLVDGSGRVGFGINTEIRDIDGDGDPDILAPGKGGLYLLENLKAQGEPGG